MKGILVPILILYGVATAQSTRLIQSCGIRYNTTNYGRDYSDTKNVRIQEGECYTRYSLSNSTGSGVTKVNSSCQPRCIAKRQNNMNLLLLNTTVMRQLAEECLYSTDHCRSCQLTSSFHTFYADQPSFNTTVDLGSCKGTCSDKNSCFPTATTNITIQGPNGYRTETKITECGCVFPKCYRRKFFKEVRPPNSNTTQIVDIGRCVGQCLGETFTFCGQIWSDPCGIKRILSANLCAALSTTREFGVDVIRTCGCRPL